MATSPNAPLLQPIGATDFGYFGHWGHLASNAPVSRLTGPRWFLAVRDMLAHPVVKGMLFAVEMMIRQAEWRVEPADDGGTAAQEIADFVESCMNDMDLTWEDALASTLLFLPYGFSLFETVYKRRLGEDGDPSSESDDGRIGWATWGYRPPETIMMFNVNDLGRLESVSQSLTLRGGKEVIIPIERLLHFKIGGAAAGYFGESILRAAFADWDAVVKLQQTEAIGIERDLAGLPVAFLPPEYFPKEGTPQAYIDTYNDIKKLVQAGRWNENAGVLFPKQLDEAGHDLWDFRLISSGGTRAFDTSAVINRRTAQMTMAILADFILLGHQTTGTYSLSVDKTRLFQTAITAWLDLVADVINHQGIVRLLRINGMDLKLAPKLVPGSLEEANLIAMSRLLASFMPLITSLAREDQLAITNHILTEVGWPEATNSDPADTPPPTPDAIAAALAAQQGAQGAQPAASPATAGPQGPAQPGAVPPGGSAG